MPIKAVMIDCSNTLFNRTGFVAGGKEMLDSLRALGLEIYLVSNELKGSYSLMNLLEQGFTKDKIVISSDVGSKKKGSKEFVKYVCQASKINSNEIVYLGDSHNDVIEAVNSNVIFFRANWTKSNCYAGIGIKSPETFVLVLKTFFISNCNWYYKMDDVDRLDRPYIVRALYDARWTSSNNTEIRDIIKNKGKLPGKEDRAKFVKNFISLRLLSSIYLEGLHLGDGDGWPKWCIYPGHQDKQVGILDDFLNVISWLFRETYLEDLIIRHKPATKSAYARSQGGSVSITNQLQTINLNPNYKRKIKNKTFLVLDDFTTDGCSFEAARNFLYNAGAKKVVCVSVGKYGYKTNVYIPRKGVSWDSFLPNNSLTERDFFLFAKTGEFNDDANLLLPPVTM